MTWLDRERLTVYPRIFLLLYGVALAISTLAGDGRLDVNGKPIGGDFVTFYAASELLAEAAPSTLYELDRLHAVELRVIGAPVERFAWHYPPPAMLAIAPLRLVTFEAALGGFLVLSIGLYALVIRAIDPEPVLLGLALSFPGLFQTVIHGQNGGLTMAVLGGGLLLLERRPILAGALFGLLLCKPHLLPVVGIALLAGRRWGALAGLLASAATIAAGSLAILGLDAWIGFVRNLGFADAALYGGGLPWEKMPTVTAALLLIGAPAAVARVLQVAVAVAVIGGVATAWAREHPHRRSVLVLAVLLATPFAFEYDLAMLALPLAWLGTTWRTEGFRRGDQALLTLGWLTPIVAPAVAWLTHLQLAPVVLGALFVTALRRESYVRGAEPQRSV